MSCLCLINRLIRKSCAVLVLCPYHTSWDFLPKVYYPICIQSFVTYPAVYRNILCGSA